MLTGPQLGAAIEAARKLKGVTKRDMAVHFNVKAPSIQGWVNRGTIDKSKLPELWAYFADVVEPSHWGLGSSGYADLLDDASRPLPAHGYVRIPVLTGTPGIAGRAKSTDSAELVDHVDIAEEWVRRTLRTAPAAMRVLTARGQSMPGVADDGDLLFIEPCTEFRDDGIYIISTGDLLRVRRLRMQVLAATLSIESTDGSPPELVPLSIANEALHICGRVIGAWVLRRL